MKKAIALILVVILTVALTACGTDDKLVGTWMLEDYTYLRQLLNDAGLSYDGFLMGLSYMGRKPEETWMMVFNKDGTGEEIMFDDATSFKYSTSSGKITLTKNGEKHVSEYKIEGDILTITDEDGSVVKFKKK